MKKSIHSGGFSERSNKTERLVQAIEAEIFTREHYFRIPTGIEHRFGEHAAKVHEILYRSLGPTTDLLRYFPDSLYLDRWRTFPEWEAGRTKPDLLAQPATLQSTGLFSFYVEYKYSDAERKRPLDGVPTPFIGIIEREAWLTYKRLTSPNPQLNTYLDGKRTRIALFYAALYAPDVLYAGWEEWLEPIADERAVRRDIARPNSKAVGFSTGSGTPWINFDLRQLKPLAAFLAEELFWDVAQAEQAAKACKQRLFNGHK